MSSNTENAKVWFDFISRNIESCLTPEHFTVCFKLIELHKEMHGAVGGFLDVLLKMALDKEALLDG